MWVLWVLVGIRVWVWDWSVPESGDWSVVGFSESGLGLGLGFGHDCEDEEKVSTVAILMVTMMMKN